MKFDNQARVEYGKNTLFEVVFQARFPGIFKISEGFPVDFQDAIRDVYPESRIDDPGLQLPPNAPEQVRSLLAGDKTFFFLSEQNDWQVSLSKEFIALTCLGRYENYSDFSSRLKKVLITFDSIYKPTYFNRLGLRYRNIINQTVLGLPGVNIKGYIPGYVAPELSGELRPDVAEFRKYVLFDDGESKAHVGHTLTTVSGKFGAHQINEEESYIVDIDCFNETRTRGVDDVITKCGIFRQNAWNIFRWSIDSSLHDAMEPRK